MGTLVSNAAMYFHHPEDCPHPASSRHRQHQRLAGSRGRAQAAGRSFATTLFTLGIVGVGLVAIPALITSSAYALAETFRWKKGLHRNFHAARPFYSVIILSTLIGIGLDFTGVSPMMALYWAAIVSGLIAPILLIGLLLVASDRKIMRQQPISLGAKLAIAFTALIMFGAVIGMF